MPEYTANQMIPSTTEISKYREIEFLANGDKEEIYIELKKLPDEYEKWLNEKSEDDTLSEKEKNILAKNIQKAKEVNKRMINTKKKC